MGNVTDWQISFAVRYAAQALHYPGIGMPLDRMDTHSLQSGGGTCPQIIRTFQHENHENGALGAKLNILSGVHPTAALLLFGGHVNKHYQHHQVHSHGGGSGGEELWQLSIF